MHEWFYFKEMQWLRRMDKNSLHMTRTLTCMALIVQSNLKVVGGMKSVTIPTWMDCIWEETISHLQME